MKPPTAVELRRRAEARLNSLAAATLENATVADTHKLLHELQVHQIELEMQNEELRKAKDEEAIALHCFTELFDFAPIAYFALDLSSKIIQVNLRGANLLGLERLSLVGRRFLSYVSPEHRMIFSRFLAQALETKDKQRCEILVQVDKHALWLSLEANIGVTTTNCLVAIVDITEHKKAEEKIKRAASVFSSAQESIIITDAAGVITEVNDAFSRITGYGPLEALGENPRFLQSGRQSPKFYADMWAVIIAKGHWRGEIWNLRKNGDIYPEMMTISAIKDAAGLVQHYVSLGTDISDLKAYQEQLEHIAHYDSLTNLPNRTLLADRLSQSMLQCQRHKRSLAVAFMDLDGFKAVNDKHGHNVGDELLVAVSHHMKEALREGDTLARIGGDEFIAVMPDLEKTEDSEPVLERLLKAAAEPITLDNDVMQVSASIGVTLYPQDGVEADQLMRHADQAMYVAKLAGKNRCHLFDMVEDNAISTQRKSIDDVRSALARREFVLNYQPKVNMRTGEVIGVEALIRWHHPNRGLVLPLELLSAIENHAVSLKVGEWVIDTALSQISQWQNLGVNLPISVNVSAYQLQQANFTNRLVALLAAHSDVNPHSLELEILETSALSDMSQVSATMNACHQLGVRFALDDFGTGYSSLTYLKRLPAYLIKIDQSFVRNMLDDDDDLAIVTAVVGLANAFQREVIAEGVETIAHGAALLQLGCVLAQGYGIARPMPADDIPQWVSSWKADESWRIVDCQSPARDLKL
jgi:diguanylate cyclase (GGDEF)-like protein/PAS domain S-box-containing protein